MSINHNYSVTNLCNEQQVINSLIEIILRLPDSYLEPLFIRYTDLIIKLDNLEKELGIRISQRMFKDINRYLELEGSGTILNYYLSNEERYSIEEWSELTQVIMYLILGGIEIDWSKAKDNLHKMKVAYLNQSFI